MGSGGEEGNLARFGSNRFLKRNSPGKSGKKGIGSPKPCLLIFEIRKSHWGVPDLELLVISSKKNSSVEKGALGSTERAESMWLKAFWVQPRWLGVVLSKKELSISDVP